MSADKSWINIRNRNSAEFKNGLRNFIEIAGKHVDRQGKTRCPCNGCYNMKFQTLEEVSDHVRCNGFSRAYTIWNWHGEEHPNMEAIRARFRSRQAPRTFETQTNNELFPLIDAVLREQDTNTDDGDNSGPAQDDEFDKLFHELNTPLFPEGSSMSLLYFIAKLMHIKVINKWTNTSFDQLLDFIKDAFPMAKNIPQSHYEAKKKLRNIGLGYDQIHACVNDCFLFWKDDDKLNNCPVCNESRWVDENKKGEKVPKKVLRYFPLTPRLRRKYSSKFTAKDMT